MQESQDTEFKVCYTDDIKREVVAFLNSGDGTVYVGIDDDGNTVGVDDADLTMQRISSSVRDSVRPDCMRFINITSYKEEGKDIVRVNVVKGTHRPYYLGEKGMRSGVYIRIGSVTQPAEEETVRELMKISDGLGYEDMVSFRQDLTFTAARKVFDGKNTDFSDREKTILGLLTANGFYTNLALLLSDQCEHSIKCSIFEGKDKRIFKDRKEFGGSLFEQIDGVLDYLNVYNKTRTVIGNRLRTDTRDYPEDAIREAVINSVIHRDYAMNGSTLISLFDDRIEIVSLGDLPNGISKEAIIVGASEPRNRKLSAVFYRLEYIEAYGTGIPRIFADYGDDEIKPQINTPKGIFQLILPNRSYKAKPAYSSRESQVNGYIEKHGRITKEEAASLFGVKPARAYVLLEQMVENDLLHCEMSGKKKVYFL